MNNVLIMSAIKKPQRCAFTAPWGFLLSGFSRKFLGLGIATLKHNSHEQDYGEPS